MTHVELNSEHGSLEELVNILQEMLTEHGDMPVVIGYQPVSEVIKRDNYSGTGYNLHRGDDGDHVFIR